MKKKVLIGIIVGSIIIATIIGIIVKKDNNKVVLTATMFNSELVGNDELWEYVEEKFNVEFEFIAVTEDNYIEKNQLLISSGDMPDLLWLDLDESNFSTYANWVKEKSFSAMPSLEELEKDYPNIYAQYALENNQGDELMTIDGVQYAHPCIRDTANYDFLSGMTWMYRRDWAKELGLYKENDIYTWDEWVNLATAMVEKDPGKNGNKNIGMGTASYYFPMAFGVYQESSEYGFGTFTLKDGKYVWTASQEETLDGLLTAKKLWDKGLIWKDNYLGESPDSYYTSGLMGMIFQNFTVSRYNNFVNAVRENLPTEDVEDVCALAKVIGKDGTYWAKQSQSYYGSVVMSANISKEKKDKWLEMLDWFLSVEGNLFMQYGIEGKDYKINNGKVEVLWETDKNDESKLVDPYPEGSRLFYEIYIGAVDTTIVPEVTYSSISVENVDSHFKFLKDKAYIRRFDYESSYFSSESKNKNASLQTETEEKMMELIVNSKYKNLSKEWNSWVKSKQKSVNSVLKDLNSLIENKPKEHSIKLAK